jgi:hypothetical protein
LLIGCRGKASYFPQAVPVNRIRDSSVDVSFGPRLDADRLRPMPRRKPENRVVWVYWVWTVVQDVQAMLKALRTARANASVHVPAKFVHGTAVLEAANRDHFVGWNLAACFQFAS